jgi:hypothetical protein
MIVPGLTVGVLMGTGVGLVVVVGVLELGMAVG